MTCGGKIIAIGVNQNGISNHRGTIGGTGKEVAELRTKDNGETLQPRPGVIGRTRPDFLENYTKRSANNPMFDELVRELESERERERAEANLLYEADRAA